MVVGLIRAFFKKRLVSAQTREVNDFTDRLKAMDGAEIGFVLVVATHIRNKMLEQGLHVMDPITDIAVNPNICAIVRRYVDVYRKSGELQDAAGAMIWLHTVRVGAFHELRPHAREMWRQLERGMPHVDQAAVDIYRMTGALPDSYGYDHFPTGLTPDPL